MAQKPTILVDLTIILDVFQHRQPFYDESARVLDAVVEGQVIGWLTAHSVVNLYNTLTIMVNQKTAVSTISRLLDVFTVATVDDPIIRQALTLGFPNFEDAVQLITAGYIGADYLVSRNAQNYYEELVPVIRPTTLLTLLNQ